MIDYLYQFGASKKIESCKSARFEDTINRIRSILELFCETYDLKVNEFTESCNIGQIHRTIISLERDGIKLIQQSGKGISRHASRASGYAEIMERLQYGVTFSKNNNRPKLFYYSLSSISKDIKLLNRQYREMTYNINPYRPAWDSHKEFYIPYYDPYDNTIMPLDERFLINTTGIAAGNTIEEAFVQGLCEIFERFCVLKVISKKITCPSIPITRLSQENQDYIREWETQGIKILIKDLSLGKSLPVVGVLFYYENVDGIDKESSSVRELAAGSATTLDEAVRRCFTEALQGGPIHKDRVQLATENISRISYLYSIFPHIQRYLPKYHLEVQCFTRHYYLDGKKLEFLQEDHGKFNWWDYANDDFLLEIHSLKQLLDKNDWHLYFHDYTWLGFPTLRVVVPELCFGHGEYDKYVPSKLLKLRHLLITDLNSLTKDDLLILDEPDCLIYLFLNKTLDKFFQVETNTLQNIEVWEFFALLLMAFKVDKLAQKFWKISSYNNHQILFQFSEFFHSTKDSILDFIQKLLPDCTIHCDQCEFLAECKYPVIKDLEKHIAQNFPSYFIQKLPSN